MTLVTYVFTPLGSTSTHVHTCAALPCPGHTHPFTPKRNTNQTAQQTQLCDLGSRSGPLTSCVTWARVSTPLSLASELYDGTGLRKCVGCF